MNRRTLLTTGGAAVIGGLAFTAPACPSKPTKEKAVKYAGLIIDLAKEGIPLLNLLGAPNIADIVSSRVIPALEKLKDALEDTDIPTSMSTLETVRNAITLVANALMNLPESPRRTTIIGILVSVRILLLTVEAFVDSEMTPVTPAADAMSAPARSSMSESIQKAFEATKP